MDAPPFCIRRGPKKKKDGICWRIRRREHMTEETYDSWEDESGGVRGEKGKVIRYSIPKLYLRV